MNRPQQIVNSLIQKIRNEFGIDDIQEALLPILDDLWDICKVPSDQELKSHLEGLHDYSILYYGLNRNEQAEAGFLRYLELADPRDINSRHYREILEFLTLISEDEGDALQAQKYYEMQYDFARERAADDWGDTAYHLGKSLFESGTYDRAQNLFQQALDAPRQDIDTNQIENALASTLVALGSYEAAESILLSLYHQLIDQNNQQPLLLTVCNNLGTLYKALGQEPKAITYFEYLAAFERSNGPSENLILYVNNLGLAYYENGEHDKALYHYLEAQDIALNILDKDDPLMANIQNQLGLYCLDHDRLDEALEYFLETRRILELQTTRDSRLASLLINIGGVYDYRQEHEKAISHYQQAMGLLKEMLPGEHPDIADLHINMGVSFAQTQELELSIMEFEAARSIHFRLLEVYLPEQGVYEQRQYLSGLYNFYEIYVNVLINAFQQSKEPDILRRCYDLVLESKHLLLESTLVFNRSNPNSSATSLKINRCSYEDLCAVLGERTVVDIIRMNQFHHTWGEHASYFVFIVRKNELDLIVYEDAEQLETNAQLYWEALDGEPAPELWELFWQPISEKVHGLHAIWYSPDGVFARINPLGFFDPERDAYVVDYLQIHTLIKVKDLIKAPLEPAVHLDRIALFNPMEEAKPADHLVYGRQEIEAIGALFPGQKVTQYHGKQASQGNFLDLKDTHLIHVTTHGRFTDPETWNENFEEEIVPPHDIWLDDEPLANSWIYLSDEQGNPVALRGNDLIKMDLQVTELVVLSACQSIAGTQLHGHGSFSLVRAFKLAGARFVIGSLWEVDDKISYTFMELFYRHLAENRDPARALTKAQLALKNSYPAAVDWAPFVLFG